MKKTKLVIVWIILAILVIWVTLFCFKDKLFTAGEKWQYAICFDEKKEKGERAACFEEYEDDFRQEFMEKFVETPEFKEMFENKNNSEAQMYIFTAWRNSPQMKAFVELVESFDEEDAKIYAQYSHLFDLEERKKEGGITDYTKDDLTRGAEIKFRRFAYNKEYLWAYSLWAVDFDMLEKAIDNYGNDPKEKEVLDQLVTDEEQYREDIGYLKKINGEWRISRWE